MSKNILYYFSGTGNCLQVAKKIAHVLGDCEIRSMANPSSKALETPHDTIGFVYPTYFQGLPSVVNNFVSQLDFSQQKSAYIYAITTYGAFVGNGLSQMNELLKAQDATLHYGRTLVMFSNYIVMYKMSDKKEEKQAKSMKNLAPILQDIQAKKENMDKLKNPNTLFLRYNQWRLEQIPDMDRDFTVSSDCISCGICQSVCPVKNITVEKGAIPLFNHHCEQCMACIQYCPKAAINYKDKTQNRGRYTNPSISWKELSSYNENKF